MPCTMAMTPDEPLAVCVHAAWLCHGSSTRKLENFVGCSLLPGVDDVF